MWSILAKTSLHYSPNRSCGSGGHFHGDPCCTSGYSWQLTLATDWNLLLSIRIPSIIRLPCWKERTQVYRHRWWWSKLHRAPLNISPRCLPSEIHVSPGWISLLRSGPFYKAGSIRYAHISVKGFPAQCQQLFSSTHYAGEIYRSAATLQHSADLYAPCAQCLKYKQIYAALILFVVISVI